LKGNKFSLCLVAANKLGSQFQSRSFLLTKA
jgi:hypothetical protein